MFTKGTRIHTPDGLRAIETLKEGDAVVSCQEDGSGPVTRRVVRVERQESVPVRRLDTYGEGSYIYFVAVTPDQLFWLKSGEHRRADELRKGASLIDAKGNATQVASNWPIYRTETPGVGWVQQLKTVRNSWGRLFDYENYEVVKKTGDQYLSPEVYGSKNPWLSVTVYGLMLDEAGPIHVGVDGLRACAL